MPKVVGQNKGYCPLFIGRVSVNTKKNNIMKKTILTLYALALIAVFTVLVTSCNVTRTITNESQYYQKGDTSVVITTKTIETYDANKK